MHTYTHTHTYMHTYTYTHTHTHIYTHANARGRIHKYYVMSIIYCQTPAVKNFLSITYCQSPTIINLLSNSIKYFLYNIILETPIASRSYRMIEACIDGIPHSRTLREPNEL